MASPSYKVYVKLGAGYEDGTYCWDDRAGETQQHEFHTDSEEEARAFRVGMNRRYPDVTYEVQLVAEDGTVLDVLP
jgi:hypothetical protein